MLRISLLTVFALALLTAPAQARLIKEMQVTRTGKVTLAQEDQVQAYRLNLDNGKYIVLGDQQFFGPATRAALDQAVERKLTVEVAGHLLIFNDQAPVFTLPLGRLDVKGLSATPAPGRQDAAEQSAGGDPAPFKAAKLKTHKAAPLGQALDGYAFFTSKAWKVENPRKAEFRGEIDLASVTAQDSRYVSRLLSPDLRDTFRSVTFVAPLAVTADGVLESSEPAVEVVFLDGTKDRLVWKEPPGYYWDRIFANRKIKLDYFLSKAAQNPKYGKPAPAAAQ